MQNKYPVASISRHRLGIDGQGIRTLIVMQECPLRCKYCLNPSTWNGERKASEMTVQELFDKVNIDRLYMLATGGGITFGGGEPLLYPNLIKEMRALCDPKLSFVVETSFNVAWNNIEKVISSVDEFVVDIKTINAVKYMEYTGGNVNVVLSNLVNLVRIVGASKVVVRIPIIPEFTDENYQKVARNFLQTIGVRRFNLFQYRVEDKKAPLESAGEEKDIIGGEKTKTLVMSIDELELTCRTYDILKNAGIYTVDDLTMHSPKELMKVRLVDKKSVDEIIAKLDELGLELKIDDDDEV